MRRGLNNQAYTILEVMIVLAVSGALVVSAMTMISGRQGRVEFNQGIHDIQSQINDVINNVATGYYAIHGDFACSLNPGGSYNWTASSGSALGTNKGCTFIGRAIQFGVAGTGLKGFNVYNLVGRQYIRGTTTDVSSITEASPVAMTQTTVNGNTIDHTEAKTLGFGLQAVKMTYNNSSTSTTGVVAIVTDFAQLSADGLMNSSRTAKIYAINNTDIDQPKFGPSGVVTKINTGAAANFITSTNDVVICFKGQTDQYGVITIGGKSRQLNTELKVYNNINDAHTAQPGACEEVS